MVPWEEQIPCLHAVQLEGNLYDVGVIVHARDYNRGLYRCLARGKAIWAVVQHLWQVFLLLQEQLC
jgi:hypothetical protein